jgi:competence protein ComEA
LKESIKQYFQFSRRERNGVFLLLFVLIALIILKFTIPFWYTADDTEAKEAFNKNALQLKELSQKTTEGEKQVALKPFNPNTATLDSLVASGINQKLARQIINYRQKVGLFASKADFKKLYNLTDSLYNRLAPFILLPNEVAQATAKKLIVEINSADSLELLAVKGIGPTYAGKILAYRRLLGGYYTLDQLGEAFYINANTLVEKEQRMAEIKAQLKVNSSIIKKININTATQKELSRHPYINYKQSKAIVKHREKKGLFTSENDLLAAGVFSADKLQLLTYYINY